MNEPRGKHWQVGKRFSIIKFVVYGHLAILALPFGAKAAEPVCPPVNYVDYVHSYKFDSTANFFTKLLSNLGLSFSVQQDAKERIQVRDDQFMALIQIGMACQIIMNDPSLTMDQKLTKVMKWSMAIITFSHGKGSWNIEQYGGAVSPVIFRAPSDILDHAIVVEIGSPITNTSVFFSPPAPPPRGATVLRLFLKKNLTMESVFELRTLLPQFNILLGHSDVGQENAVDTLFVDRDKVDEASVLDVLRSLRKVGVHIKSIQQTTFQRPEIQVGTILTRSKETSPFVAAFADAAPLNIEILRNLSGDRLWKAAFNGQAWCYPHGQGVRCSISPDGRPHL
jgi:hypothetical protein